MSEVGVRRMDFESWCDFLPGCVTWTTCETGEGFICISVKWVGEGHGLGPQGDLRMTHTAYAKALRKLQSANGGYSS